MTTDNLNIHGLWIGNELSCIEQMCIQSFIRQGHDFHLWSYNPLKNVPPGCILEDANQIIPAASVFSYANRNKFGHGKQSYAGFSDIFRYKLLYTLGGWWTDMDVTCLHPLNMSQEYVFRKNGTKGAVGNLMKCPPQSKLMSYCFEEASRQVDKNNTDWMLPIKILNTGIGIYALEKHIGDFSNEDSWPLVTAFLTGNPPVPPEWHAIHWMNEEWRRHGLEKEGFIKNSAIQQLLTEYGIHHRLLNTRQTHRVKFNLSKWNYRLINLKARTKWIVCRFLPAGLSTFFYTGIVQFFV